MKQKIYGHAECDKIHLHTKTKNRKEKTKSPQHRLKSQINVLAERCVEQKLLLYSSEECEITFNVSVFISSLSQFFTLNLASMSFISLSRCWDYFQSSIGTTESGLMFDNCVFIASRFIEQILSSQFFHSEGVFFDTTVNFFSTALS